jgi:hypothetical protein
MISIDNSMSVVEQMEAVQGKFVTPLEADLPSGEEATIGDKEKSDSPETGGEDKEASSDAEESPGDTDDEASEEAETDRPRRNPRTRRIIKLSAEVEALKAQIAAMSGTKQLETVAVEPDGGPTLEQFDGDLEKFTKATIKWEREQEKAQESKAAQEKEWSSRVAKTAEKYEDFADYAEVQIPLTPQMREFIVESEIGPELGYRLAKDTKEAQRIVGLSPIQQLRALARLELEITGTTTPPVKQVTKASAAPPPIKPLASGTSATIAKDPSKMSFQEYQSWRNSGGK